MMMTMTSKTNHQRKYQLGLTSNLKTRMLKGERSQLMLQLFLSSSSHIFSQVTFITQPILLQKLIHLHQSSWQAEDKMVQESSLMITEKLTIG
jgi:hypothetical protein